jgi:hypothetical protein
MKRLRLLFLLPLALPLLGAHPADPFSGSPSWVESVRAAKPLVLEIVAGEIDGAATDIDPLRLLEQASPSSATHLRIHVLPTDEGLVEEPTRHSVAYRLAPAGPDHSLRINARFTAPAAGSREINSDLTLRPGAWLVMGGLTREQVTLEADGTETSSRRNFVIALRLVLATGQP